MVHQTKKHFELLDAMRGVAAIAVVLFHFMEIAQPDYRNSFIPHSYLAVDFFFCLSGLSLPMPTIRSWLQLV
jgi:peptidoglycan/LPS O-acetylase OafA/YrhL